MYTARSDGVGEINNRFLAVWGDLENLLCGQRPNERRCTETKKKTYGDDGVCDGPNKSGPDGACAVVC